MKNIKHPPDYASNRKEKVYRKNKTLYFLQVNRSKLFLKNQQNVEKV